MQSRTSAPLTGEAVVAMCMMLWVHDMPVIVEVAKGPRWPEVLHVLAELMEHDKLWH